MLHTWVIYDVYVSNKRLNTFIHYHRHHLTANIFSLPNLRKGKVDVLFQVSICNILTSPCKSGLPNWRIYRFNTICCCWIFICCLERFANPSCEIHETVNFVTDVGDKRGTMIRIPKLYPDTCRLIHYFKFSHLYNDAIRLIKTPSWSFAWLFEETVSITKSMLLGTLRTWINRLSFSNIFMREKNCFRKYGRIIFVTKISKIFKF